MDASMIAPCGINCALCLTYQREENPCLGCRSISRTDTRMHCAIKSCEKRLQNGWGHCSTCDSLCAQMKQLDQRYHTKYNTNVLENLTILREKGMDALLKQQVKQWTCPDCGDLICMHRGRCLKCEPKASV